MKNWKQHLRNRLKIAGFIFALVGWFMLVTVFLEKILMQDLSSLESFVETSAFKWGIKILVIIFLILLIKGQNNINDILKKHKTLRTVLKTILIGGLIGWIVGLGSLII